MIPPNSLLQEMLDRADESSQSQDPKVRQLAADVDTLGSVLLTTRKQSVSDQPLQRVIGDLVSQYGIRPLLDELDRHCMMRLATSNSLGGLEWVAVHEKLAEASDLLETLKLDV